MNPYQEERAALVDSVQKRYLEVFGDYTDKVRDAGTTPPDDDPMEYELRKAEHALLDYPPLVEQVDPYGKPTGVWEPAGKGLKLPDRPDDLRIRPFSKQRDPQRGGFNLIPTNKWDALINHPDKPNMRKFVPKGHILSQGSVGSCASESKDGLTMATRVRLGQTPVKMNAYGTYGRVNGGYDGGSSLQANLEFAMEKGCFPEDVWPRSHGWRTEPSREAYEAAMHFRVKEIWNVANWEEFVSALLYGCGVYFGYPGHAIWATEPLPGGTRTGYCNSWGDDWGDEGFGTLNKSSIQWGYRAYAFRVVTRLGDDYRRLLESILQTAA